MLLFVRLFGAVAALHVAVAALQMNTGNTTAGGCVAPLLPPEISGPISPFGEQTFASAGVVLVIADPVDACSAVAYVPPTVEVNGCEFRTVVVVAISGSIECSQERKVRAVATGTDASAVVFVDTRFRMREYGTEYGFIGSHWSMLLDGTGGDLTIPSMIWAQESTPDFQDPFMPGVACNLTEPSSCNDTATVFAVMATEDRWMFWTPPVYVAHFLFLSIFIFYFNWRCWRNIILSRRKGGRTTDPRSVAVYVLTVEATLELGLNVLQPLIYISADLLVYPGLDLPARNPFFTKLISTLFILRGGILVSVFLLVALMLREVGRMDINVRSKSAGKRPFFARPEDRLWFTVLLTTTVLLDVLCCITIAFAVEALAFISTLFFIWTGLVLFGAFACFTIFGKRLFLALSSMKTASGNAGGMQILKMVRQSCVVTLGCMVGASFVFAGLMYDPETYAYGVLLIPLLFCLTGVSLERSQSRHLTKRKVKKSKVASASVVSSAAVSTSSPSVALSTQGGASGGGSSVGESTFATSAATTTS